ncbi:MAG: chromate transporter [Clostridia bacterium]|nr:chromate transporter [Clostridia bacterium]
MIFLDLFLGFLKVGCFAFGGAYGAIPLIRDVVMSYGWLSDEMLTYMIAVSESTPGPIMVNLATYIGNSQAGFLGAVIATLAVVLPSFLIILLVTALQKTALNNKYVQAVMRGLKPCIIGIVLATGIYMVLGSCFKTISSVRVNVQAVAITALLFALTLGYKRFAKKKLSPILLIVISAMTGIVIYAI